jgi:hypothetical protein
VPIATIRCSPNAASDGILTVVLKAPFEPEVIVLSRTGSE